MLEGPKVQAQPGNRIPVSTRPTATTPTPLILYTSWIGIRRGMLVCCLGGERESRASRRDGPRYQDMWGEEVLVRLWPRWAEIGTN